MSAAVVVAMALPWAAGCADDGNLGKGFVPRDGDTDGSSGPAFPISRDDTFYWSFSKGYAPAGTDNEKQVGGALCLRVTTVGDHYETGEETIVVGDARLSDTLGTGDVFFADQSDAAATSTDVDDTHRGLWLAALLPETRGHGLTTPTSQPFRTWRSLAPPHAMTNLLFFDIREDDGGPWNGWTSYANDLLEYFRNLFGADYASSTDLYLAPPKSAYGCAEQTTPSECASGGQGCVWDGLSCAGQFSIEVTWRQPAPAGAPAEFAAQTLMHHVLVSYNANGALKSVSEVLRVDQDPGTPVSQVASTYRACGGGQLACATSTMNLISAPWNGTPPCGF